MPITAAPTVRESIEAATETVLATPETPVVDTPAPVEATKLEATAQPAEAPKDDGRPRNSDGTFAKADEKAPEKPQVTATPVQAAPPPKPKVPRPTSWKKELEPHWETLAPEVQTYIREREGQFATGVSTYKADADRAKGVMEAVNQFAPMLQQMNIEPSHWIKNLGVAHHFLANGTAQEKVQTIADIIRNNRVDVQALGQLLAGQQPQFQQQGQTPLPQAQQQPADINAAVQAALDEREVQEKYRAFTSDVDAGKYPHFADDEVKGTMAGLLQAGLTQDYPSAYEAALAMPKHKHLVAAVTPTPAPVVDPAAQKQEQAKRARSQAVSVKSSTPSTMAQPASPQSRREALESAYDKVMGGGRV
jgi:hypothetical protein